MTNNNNMANNNSSEIIIYEGADGAPSISKIIKLI